MKSQQHWPTHNETVDRIVSSRAATKTVLTKQKNWQPLLLDFNSSTVPSVIKLTKPELLTLSHCQHVIRRNQKPLDLSEHKHLKQLETLKLILHQSQGTAHKNSQLFLIYFRPYRVDLPEPTAVSKSCQRPKRNSWARHLQRTSPMTLRFESLRQRWWSFAWHKSHLRRGSRTLYPDCNWNRTGLDIVENIELLNGPHCIRESSATAVKIKNHRFILCFLISR